MTTTTQPRTEGITLTHPHPLMGMHERGECHDSRECPACQRDRRIASQLLRAARRERRLNALLDLIDQAGHRATRTLAQLGSHDPLFTTTAVRAGMLEVRFANVLDALERIGEMQDGLEAARS